MFTKFTLFTKNGNTPCRVMLQPAEAVPLQAEAAPLHAEALLLQIEAMLEVVKVMPEHIDEKKLFLRSTSLLCAHPA